MDNSSEPISREEIEAKVRQWEKQHGQQLYRPGSNKFPFVLKFDTWDRQQQLQLPGEDDPSKGFSSVMEELLYEWLFQETLWFDNPGDSLNLSVFVEQSVEAKLCHIARFAEEKESMIARLRRKELPLIVQDSEMVIHVVTWCHGQTPEFDPFDPELPYCHSLYLKRRHADPAIAEKERQREEELSNLVRLLTDLWRGNSSPEVELLEARLEIPERSGSIGWSSAVTKLLDEVRHELERTQLNGVFTSLLYFPDRATYTRLLESMMQFEPFEMILQHRVES